MSSEVILESRGATKRFGDFTAVEGVSYQVTKGEAAGIIGPNGAGKSTFFNLLTGLYPPSEGRILFGGRDVTSLGADRRVGLGLVRTFQLVSVFNSLPVLDNLVLAVIRFGPDYDSKSGFMLGSAHKRRIADACRAQLDMVGLSGLEQVLTDELSYGDKRKLEIAMAMALKPQMLLLDEPLAGLSDVEISEVQELIQAVKHQFTLVIIEHKISRLLTLVNRLSVMHEGRLIAEGEPDTVLDDPLVREVYWGDAACTLRTPGE
jgi:branched-chain amino acid transport system ATP-binding protein